MDFTEGLGAHMHVKMLFFFRFVCFKSVIGCRNNITTDSSWLWQRGQTLGQTCFFKRAHVNKMADGLHDVGDEGTA